MTHTVGCVNPAHRVHTWLSRYYVALRAKNKIIAHRTGAVSSWGATPGRHQNACYGRGEYSSVFMLSCAVLYSTSPVILAQQPQFHAPALYSSTSTRNKRQWVSGGAYACIHLPHCAYGWCLFGRWGGAFRDPTGPGILTIWSRIWGGEEWAESL